MIEFFALFLICCAALIGMACAINYFWRAGPWISLGCAAFVVCVFLVFWASGLWEGASRHSWGMLTPAYFLIMLLCAALVLAAWLLLKFHLAKKRKKD